MKPVNMIVFRIMFCSRVRLSGKVSIRPHKDTRHRATFLLLYGAKFLLGINHVFILLTEQDGYVYFFNKRNFLALNEQYEINKVFD